MTTAEALDLSVLYERDETAWLEAMSALAAGQTGIQPLTVALDGQRPADLDPHRVRERQGHANILALR